MVDRHPVRRGVAAVRSRGGSRLRQRGRSPLGRPDILHRVAVLHRGRLPELPRGGGRRPAYAGLRPSAFLRLPAPPDRLVGHRSAICRDPVLQRQHVWRGYFTEPQLDQHVTQMGDLAEQASGYDAGDYRRTALSCVPKGLPARELDAGQRDLLRTLLATYTGRVPDGLSPQADYADDAALDAVHLAWAGPTDPGQPHYYRLQGPRLLIEYDNTQRRANHAHSVWRDPAADFGYDALGAHLTAHHR